MRTTRNQLAELPLRGTSRFAAAARQQVDELSQVDSPILLTGPAGAGKEALARAIHQSSPRCGKPFVKVDCGLLSAGDFFDSQVFGHLPGNFAGLATSSLGLIQAAHGGTVFLAGIESLELESQWKILRTWQEQAVVPLGGAEAIPVNFRMIAGSAVDLKLGVSVGLFRSDLFRLLSQQSFKLPTLAERGEDLAALAEYVLTAVSQRRKLTQSPRFTSAAVAWMQEYPWPGNLTEFYRAVDGAVGLSLESDEIDVECIRVALRKMHGNSQLSSPSRGQLLRRTRYTGFASLRAGELPRCATAK
jgi:DNA-binding NtrC family response regulator